MIKIGNLTFENGIFLAPMAGVSDSAFRTVCMQFGCDMVYSEMVSSKALYYNDKKTFEILERSEKEEPFAVQIFGSDPDIMAKTVEKAASTGAKLIDINMGCPAPKVFNNGDGCALMRDTDRIYEIVKAVRRATVLPLTVKMRSGINDKNINFIEAAKKCECAGADAIALHPRTREQQYSGSADWNHISMLKKAVKIPVIGNGDIFSAEDAIRMFDTTGCDAVMIARGAFGNPFIFSQIKELIKDGEVRTYPSLSDKINVIKKQAMLLKERKGERVCVLEMRKHAAWYLKGERNSSKARMAVNTAETTDELFSILDGLL